jgi:hypothetical protein
VGTRGDQMPSHGDHGVIQEMLATATSWLTYGPAPMELMNVGTEIVKQFFCAICAVGGLLI